MSEAGETGETGKRHYRRRQPKAIDSPMERRTYTVEEAAQLLGISRPAAYDAARSGKLPVIRIGMRVLIIRTKFDQMLAGEEPRKAASD